jgi:hypothetical protein
LGDDEHAADASAARTSANTARKDKLFIPSILDGFAGSPCDALPQLGAQTSRISCVVRHRSEGFRAAAVAALALGAACSRPALFAGARGSSADASADARASDAAIEAPSSPPPPLPAIPIGLEAYRQWDRLPTLRLDTRTVMRSTFDRSGGNEAADASHFLREAPDGTFVAADVAGPGVLAFVRTNHWHGSPWHYVVDGADTVVAESTTADPTVPVPGSTFVPAPLFPSPLAETWSTTRGADLSWVPIPFERSLELRYGRTHYGTGYFIVHRFAEGAAHTVPSILAWDGVTAPAADVLALVGRAGEDVAPTGDGVTALEGTVEVPAGTTAPLATLTGPAVVRVLELDAPADAAVALEAARLRISWDGAAAPSVDAPLPLFFGAGTLYNRDARTYLVRAFLTHVRFDPPTDTDGARIDLASYFPMPFSASAAIELVAGDVALPPLKWRIRTVLVSEAPEAQGTFHATFKDHGVPTPGEDLVVLDTQGAEGSDVWCGTFAGMSWTFSDQGVYTTLEGDPRFFFDDSATPQAQGTGTEEWGGGGDYWGGQTMTLPFAGHPVGAPGPVAGAPPRDLVESAYRHLVGDAMPFGRRARIQLEHGGLDDSTEHYTSVAYWYGRRGACLVLSDTLHVGDAGDEARHAYRSPAASAPESLTSRYEVGVASVGSREVVPATADTGRHTTGASEFRVALDPLNVGVLLRRKLDQRFADQSALVEIADDAPSAPFVRAGVWSTPGSDVVLYSNPPGELDPAAPVVEVADRRWREDEFLIARALTEGKAAIRVRLTFMPRGLPPLPGDAPRAEALSEYRYWVYSWRFPTVPPGD